MPWLLSLNDRSRVAIKTTFFPVKLHKTPVPIAYNVMSSKMACGGLSQDFNITKMCMFICEFESQNEMKIEPAYPTFFAHCLNVSVFRILWAFSSFDLSCFSFHFGSRSLKFFFNAISFSHLNRHRDGWNHVLFSRSNKS